ncbi:ciliary-associated calcium-binding coiled-coil protein 1 isoform X2 [Corvus hawaiiensis]|uniref:ciliary-associated calcium-binding coiled-coil protein 1 isoform X2 n=1 Tax=Corvus hawaiiensis TaxID=134902 RepID=UPI002018BD9C|nr:ciliary-associated calcium-binding coiled-coil protein 1 isoform X2 [Corvus hawaiiensis]
MRKLIGIEMFSIFCGQQHGDINEQNKVNVSSRSCGFSPATCPQEFSYEEVRDQEEDHDQDDAGGKEIISRAFFSLSQITALSEENLEGVEKKMEEFLNLTQLKTSLKEAILLDYYTAGFWWAKEMNFSLIQLSGFMDLLNFALENLSDKHMTLGNNLKELERAMSGIGKTDSEERGDLNLFSIEQAKAIIDYLVISLFKHYKEYEYLFHGRREEPVISNEDEIELDQPAVSPSASAREFQESDQGGYLQEPCPEAASSEADAVAEDEKSAVCEIPNEITGNLEADK